MDLIKLFISILVIISEKARISDFKKIGVAFAEKSISFEINSVFY